MKRNFEYQIMAMVMGFMLIPIFVFSTLVFVYSQKAIEDRYSISISANRDSLIQKLENKKIVLESSLMEYTNDSKEVVALKEITGLLGVYNYSEEYEVLSKWRLDKEWDEGVLNSLKTSLFTDSWTLDQMKNIEDNAPVYAMHRQFINNNGIKNYMTILVDMNILLNSTFENEVFETTFYNSEFVAISGKNKTYSNSPVINDLTKRMVNGYTETQEDKNVIHSYTYMEWNNIDFYLMQSDFGEEYKKEIRVLLVLISTISVFIMMLAFLFTWKLVRFINKKVLLLLLKDDYKEQSFTKLKNKLSETAEGIEDVMKHYDELNILKEEIQEIQTLFPEEGENYEKQFFISKNKRKEKR